MSAGNFVPYSNALEKIFLNFLKISNGAFYAALLKDTYSFDKNNHTTYQDVRPHLCTDSTCSFVPVTGMAVTRSGPSIQVNCASPISFGSSVTITAKYIVIVAGEAAKPADGDLLLGCCDMRPEGGSVSSTNGPFLISVDPKGLFSVTN